jgi:hypothetical protein
MIMKKFIKIVVLLAVALSIMTPAFAADKQADNMQILRDKIKADKKLVVAANMQLTESEAKAFWPVYEAYQKDLNTINKRIVKMINSYADDWNAKTMNDEKARTLVAEALSIQKDELKLMQSCVAKLNLLLPFIKVARYVQIENKIRAIVKYELASKVPLVQ